MNQTEKAEILISVVIPLYNEEDSLRELEQRLDKQLKEMAAESYEIIFIDDGSKDNSFAVLKELHAKNSHIKVIRFRTNFGKSAGLAVGFEAASGQYVFTMDADLQDDPSELPAMLELLKKDFDLVSGWKKIRHDPWHKTLPSSLFNSVVQKVTGLYIHDFNCGLKGYRHEVLEHLNVYGEMHRYLPAQAHWKGFKVTEQIVQHHARKHGVSKFGASRFIKGFLDLLTLVLTQRYMRRPLHLFGAVGIIFITIGFVIDLWLSIEWFMGKTTLTNRPLLLVGVLMIIVGFQSISLGLIGEMITKNNIDNKFYAVKETLD